jgi:small subunit ribosomal protein S14
MKNLIIKQQVFRENFKNFETHYLALKSIIHNQKLSPSSRWEASLLLSKFAKKQSRVMLKNRCFLTGRGRSYSRFFKLSRIQIRDLARNNELPFIKKASW